MCSLMTFKTTTNETWLLNGAIFLRWSDAIDATTTCMPKFSIVNTRLFVPTIPSKLSFDACCTQESNGSALCIVTGSSGNCGCSQSCKNLFQNGQSV